MTEAAAERKESEEAVELGRSREVGSWESLFVECPIPLGTQQTQTVSAISQPHPVAFPTCPMHAEFQALESLVWCQEYGCEVPRNGALKTMHYRRLRGRPFPVHSAQLPLCQRTAGWAPTRVTHGFKFLEATCSWTNPILWVQFPHL